MKIIICGLPGTGKTTLSKNISEKYNFELFSDWTIFEKNNIVIDNNEDKNVISKKYSDILFKTINQMDNIVVDIEYSISPNDFCKYINEDSLIIYLGFVRVDEVELFRLFRLSKSNDNVKDADLKKKISFYKKMSLDYAAQCNKNNIKFIDVDKDRNIIINDALLYLDEIIK